MTPHGMPSHHGTDAEPPGEFPNETIRLLYERGSCRVFRDQKIPPDTLETVLGAGLHAATGGNLQPYSIIQIEDDEPRRELAKLGEQAFIGDAPVSLLFCIDYHRLERWARLLDAPFTAAEAFRHFWIAFQDTTICAQNICTAADALGLGSVYIGTVLEFFPRLREMFQLPNGVFPVVLLSLGYPGAKIPVKRKLGIEAVVHRGMYREMPDHDLVQAFDRKYPGVKVEATGERKERLAAVCTKVHDEAYARRCLGRIEADGFINPAQRYFGLHYRADEMPEGNQEFLRLAEEFGFGWFREYRAPGGAAAVE
jgi:nitroreductase